MPRAPRQQPLYPEKEGTKHRPLTPRCGVQAKASEDSAFFREPVCAAEVPDYYQVIRDPMDLQTMQVQRFQVVNA